METRYKGSLQQNSAEMVGILQKTQLSYQHPTVSEGLDFLHALLAQGLGYSAINSHRSALSSIL